MVLDECEVLVVTNEEVRTGVLTMPEIHIIFELVEFKRPGCNAVFELPHGYVVRFHLINKWSLSEWILKELYE